MKTQPEFRPATSSDHDALWAIIHEVISGGDTYVFDPQTPRDQMLAYWCGPDKHTYVATLDGRIVGTFMLKDNQPGLGSHVANAGYMVASDAGGRGIGQAMCAFSLEEARRLGYRSMQFNIVVSTNERAVRLWRKMGFEIIGEIPEAFRHRNLGLVSAYVMYRKL
ncbi:GNAT family N-acetyltransferase [Larkinella soli]|uniref:GNAT family N-acetyltransferase n=1 Tax=Larkinella soli TaxID=1770527 RepID=UPI000FFB81BD|nr:GNAT family N-acetyltransferase [Larkinella soli]